VVKTKTDHEPKPASGAKDITLISLNSTPFYENIQMPTSKSLREGDSSQKMIVGSASGSRGSNLNR